MSPLKISKINSETGKVGRFSSTYLSLVNENKWNRYNYRIEEHSRTQSTLVTPYKSKHRLITDVKDQNETRKKVYTHRKMESEWNPFTIETLSIPNTARTQKKIALTLYSGTMPSFTLISHDQFHNQGLKLGLEKLQNIYRMKTLRAFFILRTNMIYEQK